MPRSTTQPSLFRAEALEHHARGRIDAQPLHRVPRWTTRAFTLLVAFVGVALVFAMVASLDEYASGPAVVRIDGRLDIVSSTAGTVVSVDVSTGDFVEEGDVLVRLDAQDLIGERDRLEAELQARMVDALRHPEDETKRGGLATLRSELALAHERLEHRLLRAERSGLVTVVRVRSGHRLGPGDPVLSIVDRVGEASVVALLPARARPMLEVGQAMRLELDGFAHAQQWVTVDAIDELVVGPAEAQRFLGPGGAGALELQGPMVIVEARLSGPTFVVDDREYRYFDGLHGTGEVVVRRESLVLAAMPGLRRLWSVAQ
jgi:multidrug resistance efflux pump